jgi:DNA protecting protein DprA
VTAGALGLSGNAERRFDLIGELPPRPRLAIVGSRAANFATLNTLAPIVEAAAKRGWSVVSGGALGIDAGVHRAALELDVVQLAVLPCGRDRLYPPNHAALFEAMANSSSAALLFAQPVGTEPSRAMFASRNAIVIGLADAVVVAEAALRSGSAGTGRLARRRGRPVAAIAGSPGCAALIGAGARALPAAPREADPDASARLIRAVGAWLDELGGATPEPAAGGPVWPEHLAWLATALRSAGPQGLTIDGLPDPIAAVLAVCEAELLGLVGEAAAGRWIAL